MLQICEWATVMQSLKEESVHHRNPEITPNRNAAVPWREKVGVIPVSCAPLSLMVGPPSAFLFGPFIGRPGYEIWKIVRRPSGKIRQFNLIVSLPKIFIKMILTQKLGSYFLLKCAMNRGYLSSRHPSSGSLVHFPLYRGFSRSLFPDMCSVWQSGYHALCGKMPVANCHRSVY